MTHARLKRLLAEAELEKDWPQEAGARRNEGHPSPNDVGARVHSIGAHGRVLGPRTSR